MASVESHISKRYAEVLQQRIQDTTKKIAILKAQQRQLNTLLDSVLAAEQLPAVDTTPIDSPSTRGVRKTSSGRPAATTLIVEVLRVANGRVMSGAEIAQEIGDRASKGAISQARRSLEERGIIAREPGGFVLVNQE